MKSSGRETRSSHVETEPRGRSPTRFKTGSQQPGMPRCVELEIVHIPEDNYYFVSSNGVFAHGYMGCLLIALGLII